MVREILKIYTDNGLGNNNPLFKGIEIQEYTYSEPRMGMPMLKATLKHGECLDNYWSGKEYVTIRGERFYIRHTPSSKKDNSDMRYVHELEFHSERDELLGNVYFYDAVYNGALTYDKPCSNSTKVTFYGTIAEIVDRINCSLRYRGIGDSILNTKTSLTTLDTPVGDGYCVMLDPYGDYDRDMSYEFSFEDQFIWAVITETYNKTEIPFEMRGRKIIFGAVPNVLDHTFRYGHDSSLLSVSHRNANAKVINRITMLGSSENIPYYYPNETEYGHISLVLKPGSQALQLSKLSIGNIYQLLSVLREGDYAILQKYSESASTPATITPKSYWTSFNKGTLTKYTLGSKLQSDPRNESADDNIWNIEVEFEVKKAGLYELNGVKGYSWMVNTTMPTDSIEYISNIVPDTLKKGPSDLSLQITKEGDVISLGHLDLGTYRFRFHIPIPSFKDNRYVIYWYVLSAVSIGENVTDAKQGYYWKTSGKTYDRIGSLGVTFDGTITDSMIGEGFGWAASDRMPFQEYLMPPKYRATKGAERFYEALNNTYTDPDTGNKYTFSNPYQAGAPNEYVYKDEKIKPTLKGITNTQGQLMGSIADVAYDADDNDALKPDSSSDSDKNDSLKYEHSFFYIKLNVFNGIYGFNLFKHASQSDPMTIQMTSGPCDGCKFKIQAVEFTDENGLKSYKNPVQTTGANGMIASGGYADKVKKDSFQDWQQDSSAYSIWICVQKDAETFGQLMPNNVHNYTPKPGNTFNIINIDLPKVYITDAERRLEELGIRYMADNNEEKFTFDINASRIFFANNPDILAQLDAYSKIKVEYNGVVYEQYVSTFEIKCDSSALPDIGIKLTDTLAVGQSFAQTVAERAASLISNPYTMGGGSSGGGGGVSTALLDKRYIGKNKPDRTPHKLASDVGFEVGNFMSGAEGGIFYRDPETGHTYIEADMMKIRMKAIFEALEIAHLSSVGGQMGITPGGSVTISYVEETGSVYRCYFKGKEEDKGAECRFVVGDQVQCREFNIMNGITVNASNRYYWRLVTAVNNDESYFELSKTDYDAASADIPKQGDTVMQLGNRTDNTRQSAILLSTVDAFAPCVTLFHGIDSYTLEDKAVIQYGVDKTKELPEPFLHCYGGFYFGPKDEKSYLKFDPASESLVFKGQLTIESTIGDQSLVDFIKDNTPQQEIKQEDIEGFVNNIVGPMFDEIQNQIDGTIETWFSEGEPTLNNKPASDWTMVELKEMHLGDLYYDNLTGSAYRFSKDNSGNYMWTVITDDAITKALAAAQKAQDTADGKRRVFVGEPKPPYDPGDLWANATYPSDGSSYSNDLLRCFTRKGKGQPFSISDWDYATKYTDDSALNAFIADYEAKMKGFEQQIDGKVETWYYSYDPTPSNAPASGWTTAEDKTSHAGDLFFNTITKKVFRWTGTQWESLTDPDIQAALDAASDAQDTADNKRRVFMGTPYVPYDEGDLWIDNGSDGKTLYVCITSRATGNFVQADWEVADDASLNAFSVTVENSLKGLRDEILGQLDGKAETWYQATDPSLNWTTAELKAMHKGDLWFNTTDNTTWYWDGTQWQAQNVPDSVFDKIDGKADVFVSKPTLGYHENDLWFLEADYTLSGHAYKEGTLCVAKRDMGTAWSANDWIKKDRYIDSFDLDAFRKEINNQLDEKSETWYQNTDPSTAWETPELKAMHVGDLWYNPDTNEVKYWDGSAWVTPDFEVPQSVFDAIDGKAAVYVKKPTKGYLARDLWFLEADYTLSGVLYKSGTLVVAKNNMGAAWDANDWTKLDRYTDDSALTTFIAGYQTTINDIKNQLDQKAETWYQGTDPSAAWTTTAEKNKHIGDLWYCTADIAGTKFKKGTTWYWNGTDWEQQDVPKSVFDEIDGKADIYVSKPGSYNVNDLWFLEADYSLGKPLIAYKTGTLVVATQSSTVFNAGHWTKKDRYTDDSALTTFIAGYQTTINDIKNQLDQKAETWYQGTDPSAAWTTTAEKNKHIGDLWYCTADIAGTKFKKGTTWYWNGTDWEQQDVPKSVFDEIDGKADIYVSKPGSYNVNDLWFLEADYSLGKPLIAYKTGTLVVATQSSTVFNAGHWTKKDRYTDDSALNAFIANYQNVIKDIKNQLDGKAETWYQAVNPATSKAPNGWHPGGLASSAQIAAANAEHKGDLWYCTADIDATYKKGTTWFWNGTAWEYQDIPESVFDRIDGKAEVFVTKPDMYLERDLWFLEKEYTLSDGTWAQGTLAVALRDMNVNLGWRGADWAKFDRYTDDTRANEAFQRFAAWAADGVFSPVEMNELQMELSRINGDKTSFADRVSVYSGVIASVTDFAKISKAYSDAYNAYKNEIEGVLNATPDADGCVAIPSTFEATMVAYYKAKSDMEALLAKAAKYHTLSEIAGYEYLKNALKEDTTINGGLIMSTLVSLGYTDANKTRHTMAGMNGSWVDTLGGRTIGSWWGGQMIDLFDKSDNRVSPVPSNAATSLIRMDGSAYFAKGYIGFRADGSGWLGNDLTGIKFNNTGSMTFGSGVRFDVSNINGLQATLNSISNFQTGLENLLKPCDKDGNEISWQQATQSDGAGGIKAKSLKAKVGFWGTDFISAKGLNPDASGGGSGVSYNRLDRWADYSTDKAGYVLSAVLGYDLYTSFNSHIGNKTVHISAEERTKWNKVVTDLAAITGPDSDNIINKWQEVVAFLDTYTEADTLANLLSNKADKSQLGNYYTKTESDNKYLLKTAYTAADVLAKLKTVDGSGSGLDADLLDGLHVSSYGTSNGVPRYFYFGAVGNNQLWINIGSLPLSSAVGSGQSYVDFEVNGLSNYGVNGGQTMIVHASTRGATRVEYVSFGSVAEGVVYHRATSSSVEIWLSTANTYTGETTIRVTRSANFTPAMTSQTAAPSGITAGTLTNARLIASTANRLQNARTINGTSFDGSSNIVTSYWGTSRSLWGQSCNGSANVSGNMTGVGSLTATGEIKTSSANAFRAVYGNYGMIIRNDGSDSYILLTASGDPHGTWNSLRPLIINNTSGLVQMNNGLSVNSLTIGNAVITWDSANGGLHISGGGLYSDSYISAKGASTGGSGGGSGTPMNRLDNWADYSTDKAGYALSAKLGWDLHTRFNDFYTVGQVDTKFVMKHGDTMRGALTISNSARNVLILKGATQGNFLGCYQGDTRRSTIGRTSSGSFISNFDANNVESTLLVGDDRVLKYSASGSDYKTVLHAGNSYISGGTITINGVSITPLTSHQSLANYVTTNTAQTISGAKTFSSILTIAPTNISGIQDGLVLHDNGSGNGEALRIKWTSASFTTGVALTGQPWLSRIESSANFVAPAFIRNGGTASQVLMADGGIKYLVNHNAGAENLGWTAENAANQIPNINTIAYWNGAHSGTASNLQYCDRGRFGDIVTQSLAGLDGRYVNTSGDTMTGRLSFKTDTQPCLILDSVTANKEVYMYVYSGGVIKTAVGWINVHGSYIYNSSSAKYLGIKDNGTPHFHGNTIWHAGNDGSGSGLDADLLDGVHESGFARGGHASYKAAGTAAARWIRIAQISNYNAYGLITLSNTYYDNPNESLMLYISSSHQPANSPRFSIIQLGGYGNLFTKARIVIGANDGPYYVEVYYITTSVNNTLNLRLANSFNMTLLQSYTAGSVPNGYSTKEITLVNGIVAPVFSGSLLGTATKLQTRRSIWGQNFDGSGNVSGLIKADSGIQIGGTSDIGWFLHSNRITAGSEIARDVNVGSLLVSNAWADASKVPTNGAYIKGVTKIGTNTASYALNTASFICDSWIRTKGATGWYNETYGGGWYMTDSTWIRAYNSKSIYTPSNIQADGNIQGATGYLGLIRFHQNDEINRFGGALYLQHRGSGMGDFGSTGNIIALANGGDMLIGTMSSASSNAVKYRLQVKGRMKLSGVADYYGIWLEGSGVCTEGYAGAAWRSGHGALNVGVDTSKGDNKQTSLLVAYTKGKGITSADNQRLFDLGILNNGSMVQTSLGTTEVLRLEKTAVTVMPLLQAKAGIQIGSATLTWDSTNAALKISSNVYSMGAVSAKGVNTAGLTGDVLTSANMVKYIPRMVLMGEFSYAGSTWSPGGVFTTGAPTFETVASARMLRLGIPSVWGAHISNFTPNMDLFAVAIPRNTVSSQIAITITNTNILVYPPSDCNRFKLCVFAINGNREIY